MIIELQVHNVKTCPSKVSMKVLHVITMDCDRSSTVPFHKSDFSINDSLNSRLLRTIAVLECSPCIIGICGDCNNFPVASQLGDWFFVFSTQSLITWLRYVSFTEWCFLRMRCASAGSCGAPWIDWGTSWSSCCGSILPEWIRNCSCGVRCVWLAKNLVGKALQGCFVLGFT